MRPIFFFEIFELNVDFRNPVKSWEKIFRFLDHSIWIGYSKFSDLQRKYFSSGVNVLTNGLKILDVTNKDFLQLTFFQGDEKAW